MKKLFVSDLDGTLLKIGNSLSAGVSLENRRCIHEFVKAGNVFAIASARGEQYVDSIERMLGLRPDFIGHNGTTLMIGGTVLKQYFPSQFYFSVKQALEDEHLHATVILHTEKASYLEKKDAYPFGFDNPLHTTAMLRNNLEVLPDLEEEKTLGIALFVEPERMEFVKQRMKELFSEEAEVVSSDLDLINLSPKGCTKGNGVLRLMEHYGLSPQDVAVIGDSDNDVNMFEVTEHSYCMDHSEDAVKKKAAHVVASVEEAVIDFMKNDSMGDRT